MKLFMPRSALPKDCTGYTVYTGYHPIKLYTVHFHKMRIKRRQRRAWMMK